VIYLALAQRGRLLWRAVLVLLVICGGWVFAWKWFLEHLSASREEEGELLVLVDRDGDWSIGEANWVRIESAWNGQYELLVPADSNLDYAELLAARPITGEGIVFRFVDLHTHSSEMLDLRVKDRSGELSYVATGLWNGDPIMGGLDGEIVFSAHPCLDFSVLDCRYRVDGLVKRIIGADVAVRIEGRFRLVPLED
jgi:hypothetical protein